MSIEDRCASKRIKQEKQNNRQEERRKQKILGMKKPPKIKGGKKSHTASEEIDRRPCNETECFCQGCMDGFYD